MSEPKSKGRSLHYGVREVGSFELCTERMWGTREEVEIVLADFELAKPHIERHHKVRSVGKLEIVRVEVTPV